MDIFADLWAAAKAGGAFATPFVLVVLYFINEERKEVIKENRVLNAKNEGKNEAMIERLLTSLNSVNTTLKALQEMFAAGRKQ